MQHLGPYEPTLPGTVNLPSVAEKPVKQVQVMQQLGGKSHQPSPADKDNGTPVIQEVESEPSLKPSQVKPLNGRATQVTQQIGPYEPTVTEPLPKSTQSSTNSSTHGTQAMQAKGPQKPSVPVPLPKPSQAKGREGRGVTQVTQQIGPYEPTVPGQSPKQSTPVKGNGVQVMQQLGPYEPTVPGTSPKEPPLKESPVTGKGTKLPKQDACETSVPDHVSAAAASRGNSSDRQNNSKETDSSRTGAQSDHKPGTVLNRASYKMANLADWDQDHLYVIDI